MVENLTLGFYTETVSRALEFRPEIHRFLRSRSTSPEDAEDLLQDTYLKLLEGQEKFDPEKGALKKWLLRIAHNAHVDLVRSNLRRPTVEISEGDACYNFTDEADDQVDTNALLDRMKPILSGAQVDIINLATQGCTNPQIAERMGLSVATVKTQRHRVRLKSTELRAVV